MVANYVDIFSLLLVIGGTMVLGMMNLTLRDCRMLWGYITRSIMFDADAEIKLYMNAMIKNSIAIRNNKIDVERVIENQSGVGPVFEIGARMMNDALQKDEMLNVIERKIASQNADRGRIISILPRAAEIAPAMGLIGTLIGLVQLLSHLDNPSEIGPGMAVALLTTLYGAVFGHIILRPLGERVLNVIRMDSIRDQIDTLMILSIHNRENPRQLELKFFTLLPNSVDCSYFD